MGELEGVVKVAIGQTDMEGLKRYLGGVRVDRGIEEIVLHHTWSPTAAQYAGKKTWEAIRRYHVKERGWSDIGYHFGIGPDDSLWRLRPVTLSGAHVLNRNKHTVGIVMIGNFDVEDPVTNGLGMTAQVVKILLERFHLGVQQIRFHREFQNKTCPGTRISLDRFRKMVSEVEVKELMTAQEVDREQMVKMVEVTTGKVVGSFILVAKGDHIADQGKVYVRR